VNRSPLRRDAARRTTIDLPELARLLGVSRASAYRAVARGEIRAVRLGRRIVVPLKEVGRLLGEQPGAVDGSR
jgi:excisionase family DNA binding protein